MTDLSPQFSLFLIPLSTVVTVFPPESILLGCVVLGSSIFGIDVSALLGDTEEDDHTERDNDDSDAFFNEPAGDAFAEDTDFNDTSGDSTEIPEENPTNENEVSDVKERVDDLETELEQVSSTIGSIRSENEEIGESVAAVEENVRKLLEVYELVTQGINPFVDEREQGEVSGAELDIFAEETDTSSDGPGERTDLFDETSDGNPSSTAPIDESDFEFSQDEPDTSEDDLRTFEDLKSEYDSTEEEAEESDLEFGSSADTAMSSEEEGEESTSESTDSITATEENTADPPDTDSNEAGETSKNQSSQKPGDSSTPYLTELPEGFGTEIIVFEWMTYLYQSGGLRASNQALRYYQNLGWISTDVATKLRKVLRGIPSDSTPNSGLRADGSGTQELTISHHKTSLSYISKLSDNEVTPSSFERQPRGEYGI